MSIQLPSGWAWITPGDVATADPYALAIGPFGSNLKVSDYTRAGVPLVFVRHIRAEQFERDGSPCVSATKARELSAHSVRGGDVLVTKMGDPPGDSALYPLHLPTGIITADCLKWSIDSRVGHAKFFMYALRTPAARHQLLSITQGVAQRKISLGRFKTISFPCPPLREQARIVEVLDSYTSRLDAAVANLEAARKKLNAYRASVLKAAVEGQLVPTEAELTRKEGRSYEPADVLLARILKERRRCWEEADLAKMKAAGRTPKDDGWKAKYEEPITPLGGGLQTLPNGWCWATVGQLGEVTGGLTKNATRDALPRRYPYLRVANVHADRLALDEVKEIGVDDEELPRILLQRGDLLVVEGNGSVDQIGRVAIWDGSIQSAVHQNHLIKVRFTHVPLERWVLLWLLSPGGRRMIERVASSTSGLHTLSISKVQNLPVPLPPVDEQVRLIETIDQLLSIVDANTTNIDAGLRRCSRLQQSVLKWAFEGKLADQDPSDEPAEALLARARAERSATAPVRKLRVRKMRAAS